MSEPMGVNMSSWNYRVMRHSARNSSGQEWFAIHEVFYDDNGTPYAASEEACAAFGETSDELFDDMKRMQSAFDRPILDYDTLFSERG
jgi:hypothetical protein